MRSSVPAYSQYLDVKNRAWRRRSCGIVALKMLMDHYKPRHAARRTLPRLIARGQHAGAYIRNVGWSHRGLAHLAGRYGFRGKNYDWWKRSPRLALKALNIHLKKGPVLASIYRNLRPNAHGHLVVVTEVKRGVVRYHDPDSPTRHGIMRRAPLNKFLAGWKRRIIVVRPRIAKRKTG